MHILSKISGFLKEFDIIFSKEVNIFIDYSPRSKMLVENGIKNTSPN